MLNKLKTKILEKLGEKKMTAKGLDILLNRPEGYTLWMLENNDIRRFPYNDEDPLAHFLGLTEKEISLLNGRDAGEKTNKYISTLSSYLYSDAKTHGNEGWESLPGKLAVYLRSCDMPGAVRDTEVSPIENEEYEIEPANHRTDQFYTAGPVYRKKLGEEFFVYLTKSIAEKIDEDTYEESNSELFGIYLIDKKGHLVDYIEVESDYAFVLGLYKKYLELSELYDIMHLSFDDDDYYI